MAASTTATCSGGLRNPVHHESRLKKKQVSKLDLIVKCIHLQALARTLFPFLFFFLESSVILPYFPHKQDYKKEGETG